MFYLLYYSSFSSWFSHSPSGNYIFKLLKVCNSLIFIFFSNLYMSIIFFFSIFLFYFLLYIFLFLFGSILIFYFVFNFAIDVFCLFDGNSRSNLDSLMHWNIILSQASSTDRSFSFIPLFWHYSLWNLLSER